METTETPVVEIIEAVSNPEDVENETIQMLLSVSENVGTIAETQQNQSVVNAINNAMTVTEARLAEPNEDSAEQNGDTVTVTVTEAVLVGEAKEEPTEDQDANNSSAVSIELETQQNQSVVNAINKAMTLTEANVRLADPNEDSAEQNGNTVILTVTEAVLVEEPNGKATGDQDPDNSSSVSIEQNESNNDNDENNDSKTTTNINVTPNIKRRKGSKARNKGIKRRRYYRTAPLKSEIKSETNSTPGVETDPEGDTPNSKKQKMYSQRFRDEWQLDPKFSDWLEKVPESHKKARCNKCQCLLQAKKSSLESHCLSEKHKGINDDDLFEGSEGEPETIVIQAETIIDSEQAAVQVLAENRQAAAAVALAAEREELLGPDGKPLSKTKMSYNEKRRVMRAELERATQRAELKISAWSAEHHIPFRALESLTAVLSESFSDSRIAKKLKMKRTKASCVVYNVIGKDFIESVERSLQQVTELGKTRYSLILNEIAVTGSESETQMAIVVKYFDGSTLLTRLLGLISIAEQNSDILFDELAKLIASKGLTLNECIGWTVLGADPCDIFHGQINSLRTRLMEVNPSIVAFRCTCHNAALVASHACEVLPSGCEKLVHDIYNFFSRMNKRTTQYGDFQEFVETQPHRLLKPFQTQWLSLLQCVSCIVEKWTGLLGFMQEQLTAGKNQRAKEVLDAMSNPYNKLFFEFLTFVLPKIDALNLTSQGISPTVDNIHDHISMPYKDLLALYMQPAYIKQNPVSHLSPTSEFHMQPLENTYLGTTVMRGLGALSEPPESKGQFVAVCRNFMMTACQQIQQRFPLDDPILTAASKISVESAKSGKVVSFVTEIMCHFPQILELTNEQDVDNQWRNLMFDTDLPGELEFEVFWQKLMSNPKYASLWFCIKAIMMLPVPNTDSDRLFAQIDKARTAEKNRISLNSILKVISAQESIRTTQGSDTFEPTETMYMKFHDDIYTVK